ncbi:LytTR family transcriptional regulator DNA-binding domain-containing protein [Chitinophaga horti]|uniref:LytTR family transcriptional regulator DNA-binding domain-containing protein n=1 Tax=Chitinophaga horti TaxID=2920382 RepID=A0ABY6J544_9BACT|nr:LytTR family DNA-binding domain-containing protein [Chitinophaga horti]UYQ94800.1 LytTR family transcriptional regulator DNA-binding domain-containing protein [Chitinophaga horti]
MKILCKDHEMAAAKQLIALVSSIDPRIEIVHEPQRPAAQRFLARSGSRLCSVPVEDIAYFYIRNRLCCIRTIHNTDHFITKSLDDVEQETDNTLFFRINRQFIVNYRHIQQVQAWFSGKLKVKVKPEVPEDIIVSRLKASEFKKWLGE